MTHLYAGAKGTILQVAVAKTKCGLLKPFVFGKMPSDVVVQIGRVTCLDCIRLHNGLRNKDFSAQLGKKAQ